MILDNCPIHAFGCIKFKVIIVTKVALYGINIYVVTDVENSFVLKVIMYTGNYTYSKNYNTDMLNTVKVFCELCKPFEGSQCTIFIGRFYTSVLLLEELYKISLYINEPVIKNRLPEELKINKTSKTQGDGALILCIP